MKIPSQDGRRNWLFEQKEIHNVDKVSKWGFTRKLLEEAEEAYLLELYYASIFCSNTSLISLIFQKVEGIREYTPVIANLLNRLFSREVNILYKDIKLKELYSLFQIEQNYDVKINTKSMGSYIKILEKSDVSE